MGRKNMAEKTRVRAHLEQKFEMSYFLQMLVWNCFEQLFKKFGTWISLITFAKISIKCFAKSTIYNRKYLLKHPAQVSDWQIEVSCVTNVKLRMIIRDNAGLLACRKLSRASSSRARFAAPFIRYLTIRQRRRPWKRRWKIDFSAFYIFAWLFQGAQLLKKREFGLELKTRDRARVQTDIV